MKAEIDAVRIMKNMMTVTVKVKRMKELRFRVKVASLFFAIGARILNCEIKLEEDNE